MDRKRYVLIGTGASSVRKTRITRSVLGPLSCNSTPRWSTKARAWHDAFVWIVSHGHASSEGFWYDQDENEWVIVLTGTARLRFEEETVEMKPGDFVNIPSHRKHRVEWTTPGELTIWLAVFYCSKKSPE